MSLLFFISFCLILGFKFVSAVLLSPAFLQLVVSLSALPTEEREREIESTEKRNDKSCLELQIAFADLSGIRLMHADRRREQASAAAVENCSVRVGRIERASIRFGFVIELPFPLPRSFCPSQFGACRFASAFADSVDSSSRR